MRESILTFKSMSTDETIQFGEKLGRLLAPGHVLALVGELGAGKTTLIKGIVKGLDVTEKRVVKSPTFSLVHKYIGRVPIYHFDAYRLESIQDMLNIGSDEMIFGNGVSLIEWADKVVKSLPREYLKITLTHISENQRIIELQSYGKEYDRIIRNLIIKKSI